MEKVRFVIQGYYVCSAQLLLTCAHKLQYQMKNQNMIASMEKALLERTVT